jgi:hypothetical protein
MYAATTKDDGNAADGRFSANLLMVESLEHRDKASHKALDKLN